MIIEKTMNDRWLSNTWLVADKPGGHAVVIDTGGPTEPIFQTVRDQCRRRIGCDRVFE